MTRIVRACEAVNDAMLGAADSLVRLLREMHGYVPDEMEHHLLDEDDRAELDARAFGRTLAEIDEL